MEARLNQVLELTREPHPEDDRFVDAVMSRARADVERRSVRRLITGPAAIAAAAVLVIGGSVAALVRSTDVAPEIAAPTIVGTQPGEPPDPSILTAVPTIEAPDPSAAGGATPTTYRRGDREWGYTSQASAFAMDHETGLRLATDVARTEFDTDVPQKVTLTLTNTGTRPVAVAAPGGCALMVGVYAAEGDDAENYAWRCATAAGDPRQAEDRFVLKPGQERVAEATIVLGAAGDWRVVGMCRCSYEEATPATPAPQPNPLEDIPALATGVPLSPTTDEPAQNGDERLVTPPIQIKTS